MIVVVPLHQHLYDARMKIFLRRALSFTCFTSTFIATSCVGDDLAIQQKPDGGGQEDGGTLADGGSSGLVADGSSDSGPACAARCEASTLIRCDGTSEPCTFSCEVEGGAHCAVIHPTGTWMTPADVEVPDTRDIIIDQPLVKFDTETGAIGGVRAPNTDPLSREIKDGISFHVASIDTSHKIGIWSFRTLTIRTNSTIYFTSKNAVGLAATDITVQGIVDGRGYSGTGVLCGGDYAFAADYVAGVAGPGGGTGGVCSRPPVAAGGPGGGQRGVPLGGPSGGSYGSFGGSGGDGDGNGKRGGPLTPMYGTPELVPLLAGSGGGCAGGDGDVAPGGGGGGALHLVAAKKLTVGTVGQVAGINFGGCGGQRGIVGIGGGGGGSGGALLIEATTLTLLEGAALAVNGGGGGGACEFEESPEPFLGKPGALGGNAAAGGRVQTGYGLAGAGAANIAAISGTASANGPGGSGGGGAGRIRINTRAGSFTPPANAILSPNLNSVLGATTTGILDVR